MVLTSMLAVVGALSSPQPTDLPQQRADPPPPKVMTGALEMGLYTGQQSDHAAVAISPLLTVGVRPRPEVELGLSMGAATLTAQNRDPQTRISTDRVRVSTPSNFVFGTRWVRDEDTRHRGYAGFQFALPTTFDIDDNVRRASDYARAVRGGFNAWQWTPATLGVVLPVGWSYRLMSWLDVGADGALGGLFAAGGNPIDPGFVGQVRGRAAVHVSRLELGAAVGAVYNEQDPRGHLQTSATPYAEFGLCRRGQGKARNNACALRARGAASFNLSGPYGVGNDGMKVWASSSGWLGRYAISSSDPSAVSKKPAPLDGSRAFLRSYDGCVDPSQYVSTRVEDVSFGDICARAALEVAMGNF